MGRIGDFIMTKLEALAHYLQIDPEEIKLSTEQVNPFTEYITPKGTFTVLDEDEAFEELVEDQKQIVADIGFKDSYVEWFREWIYENAIEQDSLEDDCREFYDMLISDLEHVNDIEFGTGLNAECVEAGIIDPSDIVDYEYVGDKPLADLLAEHRVDQIRKDYNGNFAKWFVDYYGEEFLPDRIDNGSVALDFETIAHELIKLDGYGHFLARYDGETHELENGYYAFLQDN